MKEISLTPFEVYSNLVSAITANARMVREGRWTMQDYLDATAKSILWFSSLYPTTQFPESNSLLHGTARILENNLREKQGGQRQ